MSADVGYATIDILGKLQTSISEFRAETNERFGEIGSSIRKERNSAGMLVTLRATARDFDTRVNEIEARVAAIEART